MEEDVTKQPSKTQEVSASASPKFWQLRKSRGFLISMAVLIALGSGLVIVLAFQLSMIDQQTKTLKQGVQQLRAQLVMWDAHMVDPREKNDEMKRSAQDRDNVLGAIAHNVRHTYEGDESPDATLGSRLDADATETSCTDLRELEGVESGYFGIDASQLQVVDETVRGFVPEDQQDVFSQSLTGELEKGGQQLQRLCDFDGRIFAVVQTGVTNAVSNEFITVLEWDQTDSRFHAYQPMSGIPSEHAIFHPDVVTGDMLISFSYADFGALEWWVYRLDQNGYTSDLIESCVDRPQDYLSEDPDPAKREVVCSRAVKSLP